MGEEQGLGSSEEDDARIVNAAENGNNGLGVSIQVHNSLPVPQQQPQNSVIRWERFLPIRSLKVLLVEDDDSTRQVVGALLRNCSYEVTTAANGLDAWKILENMNNQIDLVLTEVVMPVVSGIGLLSKIINHRTLKNIPVIMMSSHDSMGIVFKCLSKGAVDFLVKPIRKNELKNLWQHVWRRCHSSSGSGSESATQSRRSIKPKSAEESGDNSDSNNELYDNGSNGHSIRDGSDNGSGTQSSWTKRVAEFDSPRQVSHSDQSADAPDSTCAQVIHTKPETSGNKCVHAVDTKQHLAKDEKHDDDDDDDALGKNPDVGKLGNSDEQGDYRRQSLSSDPSSTRKNILSDKANNPAENGHLEHTSDRPKPCSRNANCINLHAKIKKLNASAGSDTPLVKDKTYHDPGDSLSLEISLKSMKGFGDGCSAVNDERNVLRHSDLSAFSKYKTGSSANQPIQNCRISSPKQVIPAKIEDTGVNTPKAPGKGATQQVQVQHHHHHHHHHYHHHVRNRQQNEAEPKDDHLSVKDVTAASGQHGSSNIVEGPIEGTAGNYSMNGSGSGSNHGSNGQNGCSLGLNTALTNTESDNKGCADAAAREASGKMGGNAVPEDRAAQREAALSKFRQKRKDRSFEKKVRYQSRKRLAEQRPRVKGQFVRQSMSDNKSRKEATSNDLTSEDNSCNSLR